MKMKVAKGVVYVIQECMDNAYLKYLGLTSKAGSMLAS